MCSIRKIGEQQYKEIIKNLPVPFHVINDKFEIIFMNRAMKEWLKQLGFNPAIIGLTIFEAFPFLTQKIHDEYDYVLREGKVLYTEEGRSLYNKEINTEVGKIPIIRDGKVIQIITTISDITKRKKAEKKLEESEEKFRTIAESSPLGIAIFQDDMVKYVNKRWEDLTGSKVEDITQWKLSKFFRPVLSEDLNMVTHHAELRQKGLKDEINNYIYRALSRSKEILWFEVFANTIMYKNRPADLAITLDITEKIKSEQKLKESEHKLKERVKELSCLFDSSKILVEPNISIEEILQKTVELLPSAFQFPDKVCGRIIYSKKKYLTPNFQESKWKISIYETIKDEMLKLEIYYIEENEFLEEEIYLLNDIRNRLKNIIEQKEAEILLKTSEENYKALYEEAPTAYFSISPNQAILRSNEVAEKLLGYTKDEFLKMGVFDLYYDSKYGIERAKNVFKQFLNGESIKDRELQMKKKNGDPIWVSLSVNPIFDLKGNVIESRSMVLDVSERKLAQEEVKNSYKRLEELEYIINNSPGIVFLWKNSEGWPVEFVSENIEHFGYTPEDFYSGNVLYSEIIHPEDLERVAEDVEIYSNEDIDEFVQEYRILTKDGEERWIDDRTWMRKDSEGNITHFQGIVLDITDRKIFEEALKVSEKKYKEAYDQANFYKDIFAHDINNILQVINSSADLISFHLGESDKSKDIKNLSDIIKKQVERGSKLVSNVRTLSDLDEKEFSKEKIAVCESLKKSIEYVKKTYSNRELNILVDSLDKKLFSMANELLQDVFENILINGIKYNDHSKVDILIKISHQEVENRNYLKMEFIDNGIGIPDDRKAVIFKSGNRALKGSKGMGLGLSLVSKIVNIFNGKIWVEDRVKGDYTKGSNFVLLLPESI